MRETFWAIYALAYDTLSKLKPYRQMIEEAKQLLEVKPNNKVLDLGCGTGNLIEKLILGNAVISGVDFSSAMLNRASLKLGRYGNVDLKKIDFCKQPLPFSSSTFDSVAMINVLHALPSPDSVLEELVRVTKDGGRVVIATPLPGASPLRVFKDHFGKSSTIREKLILIYIMPALLWLLFCNVFMLSRSKFYLPNEMDKLLKNHGLKIVKNTRTYAGQNMLILARVEHG